MSFYKKLFIWNLSISAVMFFGLTIYGMTLPYNENGVYFHDGVSLSSDAIVTYATSGFISLAAAIGLKIFWKENETTTSITTPK